MTDQRDVRRKRLAYRAMHRGTRETDLVIGGFVQRWVDRINDEQLSRLEALLETPDQDLYDWITGRVDPPSERRSDVLELMIQDHQSTPRPLRLASD